MESIRQIYRIGHGPSSSHTMGPMRAAQMFLERNRGAVRFNVTLYGSLAATGKGHMTDAAILAVLQPVAKTNIIWEPKVFLPFHPSDRIELPLCLAYRETLAKPLALKLVGFIRNGMRR